MIIQIWNLFVNQLDIKEDWDKVQTNISRPSLLNCIPIQSTWARYHDSHPVMIGRMSHFVVALCCRCQRSQHTIAHEYWCGRVAWVMEAASVMEQVLVKSWHERPNFFPLTTIIALGRFTSSSRRVVYHTSDLTSLFFPFVFWPPFGLAHCPLLFYAGTHMNIAPYGISLPIVWGWKSSRQCARVGSGPKHQYELVYHITSRNMTPNQEGNPRTRSWACALAMHP